MISFTVHEPPGPFADKLERAENVVMVRDGFSFWAAIATPIWMLMNRLWLPLLAYLGVLLVLGSIVALIDLDAEIVSWAMLAMHVLAGFENASLLRYGLKQRGFTEVGSVSGQSVAECERRFFDDWLQGQPFLSRDALSPPSSRAGRLPGRAPAVFSLWSGRSR